MTKRQIKHKIERTQDRIDDLKLREENLSKHGHWSLGYFEGRLSVLEDLLDEIEEEDEHES